MVGTVIDAEMSGQMRVTIVATGLGRLKCAEDAPRIVPNSSANMDYKEYDPPTVVRRKNVRADEGLQGGPDYLDIPAFLRRSGRISTIFPIFN